MSDKNTASALIENDRRGFSKLVSIIRQHSRNKRIRLFKKHFKVGTDTKVLDLGGWDGSHVNALIAGTEIRRSNVYVADIDEDAIRQAHERHGFTPVLIPEDGQLPFPDGYFDVVFCSSVLEHVTVPKSQMWDIRSGKIFRDISMAHQEEFSAEIRRLAKAYYVQVPYRRFPIETHSWLPFLAQLPRSLQIYAIKIANRFWIKKTIPDFYLPNVSEMRHYFPGARIFWEKSLGLKKSLIAISSDNS